MEKQYRKDLERLCFTTESKKRLVRNIINSQEKLPARPKKRWVSKKSAAVTVALAACLLLGAGTAAAHIRPILQEYYQDSIGYQQSVLSVGQSITKKGWTMTITDCVWDDNNINVGISLTAPEDIKLDEKAYYLGQWRIQFPLSGITSSGTYRQKDNDNLTDNTLRFILWITCTSFPEEGRGLGGRTICLSLGDLFHHTQWNEQTFRWEQEYDCREVWNFRITLPEKNNTIYLSPNVLVHTLGVDATLTKVDISPFGVYAFIEGNSLIGHHDWVKKNRPQNAPDDWYGCIEEQEIMVFFKNGSAVTLEQGIAGSGCSGGSDDSEPGYLKIYRRFDELVDVESIDYISICGVSIPLS